MTFPLEIAFRNLKPHDSINEEIRTRAAKLGNFSTDIIACRVIVEMPHRHHKGGHSNPFHMVINLETLWGELSVTRAANLHGSSSDLGTTEWTKALEIDGARKDVHLVIRKAFDAARRQLQDHIRRHRHSRPHHQHRTVRRGDNSLSHTSHEQP